MHPMVIVLQNTESIERYYACIAFLPIVAHSIKTHLCYLEFLMAHIIEVLRLFCGLQRILLLTKIVTAALVHKMRAKKRLSFSNAAHKI